MTQFWFFLSIALLVFSAIGLLISVLLARTSRTVSDRVLQVAKGGAGVLHPKSSSTATLQKQLFDSVYWVRSRIGMSETEKLRERFSNAGLTASTARELYFAARLLGPLAAVLAGSFLPSKPLSWMLLLGGLSYLLPDVLLNRLIKRHREKIRRSIPDAIDLLVICVDAGLGMDQAMLRVGQELEPSHPEIYQEFMQINREQRAGKLRLEAWQSMAKRIKLPEIDGFVNMLMQNERFGTPIAKALSIYGDGIRQKRRQHAEELAAKTTVKIIFPLVFCIFPSMFIVLLGPAGITISRGLAGGLQ